MRAPPLISTRARERELLPQRAGWTTWTAHLAGKLNSDLKISASRSAVGDRSQYSDVCECHISGECGTLRRIRQAKITIPVGAFYDGRGRRRGLIAVEVVSRPSLVLHSVVVRLGVSHSSAVPTASDRAQLNWRLGSRGIAVCRYPSALTSLSANG